MDEKKLITRATELKEMYELGFIHLWQFKDEIQKVADYYGVTYGCVISLI